MTGLWSFRIHFYQNFVRVLMLISIILPSLTLSQQDSDFKDELVSDRWLAPTGCVFDKEGRIYVWEKNGKVYLQEDEKKKLILDISEEVANWSDHGLLSVALHPNFLTNGWIYLYYVVDRHYLLFFDTPHYDPNKTTTREASIARVTRYTVHTNQNFQVDLLSRKVILGKSLGDGIPILFESHGAGSLLFGTDGTLLISSGDGSTYVKPYGGGDPNASYAHQAISDGILAPKKDVGSFRSQMVDALNGKILRIDPNTGLGIPSNPFFDEAEPYSARSKVWAMGLRNPFRFTLRPGTGSHNPDEGDPGTIFVGDVGSSFWEEINVISKPGQNFGWPLYEGFEPLRKYDNLDILNPDIPHPLHNTDLCDNPFYAFEDLLIPKEGMRSDFLNSCSRQSLNIDEEHTFVHERPTVAYSNSTFNPPARTLVPYFDTYGFPREMLVEESHSLTNAQSFSGSSSSCGVFYTGNSFPEKYTLSFIAVDLFQGMKKMDFGLQNELLSVEEFYSDLNGVVDIKVNPKSGDLYYVLYYSGELRKISFGGSAKPEPFIEADRLYGPKAFEVQFSAKNSIDTKGGKLTYLWDFGDGTTSKEVSPTHYFNAPNLDPTVYTVTLKVTNNEGVSAVAEQNISLNNTPPSIEFTSFTDGDYYAANGVTLLSLSAEVTDKEHSPEELKYAWQVFLHHNEHFHPEPVDTIAVSSTLLSAVGCGLETYYYRIGLTVSDPTGLSNYQEGHLYPYCGPEIAEIDSLTIIKEDEKLSLHWKSIHEDLIIHYEIQRSFDKNNFITIGQISATRNPFGYHFFDRDTLFGKIFYRLKYITEDRKYQYSHVSSVYLEDTPKDDILIYPNPIKNEISIKGFNSPAKMKLFNIYGQPIRFWQLKPLNENKSAYKFPVNDLIPGTYFYTIEINKEIVKGILQKID